jgi:UDP-glucose 4-epimerase
VIDDLSSGSAANLPDHHQLTFTQADVRSGSEMTDLLRGCHVVFHLATRNVRLSLVQPSLVHDVNANGTFNVLKAAAANGVRRFLYCSSSEVNGSARQVPMPEDYHYEPETIYGASKLTGEYYTQVFQRSGWLQTVIARPHNNYGPRSHYRGNKREVIPRFILWALGGEPLLIHGTGTQTRDFTYVAETAEYLIRLVEADTAVGGTFNVCRGEEVSMLELALAIKELTQTKSPLIHVPGRPSDVQRLWGDATRLRKLLGDSPSVSWREGLRDTIAWFREHVPLTEDVKASLNARTWAADPVETWIPSSSATSLQEAA